MRTYRVTQSTRQLVGTTPYRFVEKAQLTEILLEEIRSNLRPPARAAETVQTRDRVPGRWGNRRNGRGFCQ